MCFPQAEAKRGPRPLKERSDVSAKPQSNARPSASNFDLSVCLHTLFGKSFGLAFSKASGAWGRAPYTSVFFLIAFLLRIFRQKKKRVTNFDLRGSCLRLPCRGQAYRLLRKPRRPENDGVNFAYGYLQLLILQGLSALQVAFCL